MSGERIFGENSSTFVEDLAAELLTGGSADSIPSKQSIEAWMSSIQAFVKALTTVVPHQVALEEVIGDLRSTVLEVRRTLLYTACAYARLTGWQSGWLTG